MNSYAVNTAMCLAMVAFPYNVACWTVGAGIYYTGDTGLMLLWGAPVGLPICLYLWVLQKRGLA